jgi:hypothetical protein
VECSGITVQCRALKALGRAAVRCLTDAERGKSPGLPRGFVAALLRRDLSPDLSPAPRGAESCNEFWMPRSPILTWFRRNPVGAAMISSPVSRSMMMISSRMRLSSTSMLLSLL